MQGNQVAMCRGHEGPVNSVCVTADNKIVSGSADRTVRVWDMQGKELAVCRGHEGWVFSICVTPDNKIVSGSNDTTVRIWHLAPILLLEQISSIVFQNQRSTEALWTYLQQITGNEDPQFHLGILKKFVMASTNA
jgi:WD40 repeat protein